MLSSHVLIVETYEFDYLISRLKKSDEGRLYLYCFFYNVTNGFNIIWSSYPSPSSCDSSSLYLLKHDSMQLLSNIYSADFIRYPCVLLTLPIHAMCIAIKNSFPLTDTHYRLIAIKKITMGPLILGLKWWKHSCKEISSTERKRGREREQENEEEGEGQGGRNKNTVYSAHHIL